MDKKVLFKVVNAKHYTKDNKELDCLVCSVDVILPTEKGVEAQPIHVEWKDFKQKALDFEKVIKKDDLIKTENGLNIGGFSIPWNMQYIFLQLVEKGYFE